MRFPIFALIAPLIASCVLWAVTGSAYTLLFALLGPVMAVAQFADGKLHSRRSAKNREKENEEELLRTVVEEQRLRDEERQQQLRQYPAAAVYSAGDAHFRPRWAAGDVLSGNQRIVRLGLSATQATPVLLDLSAGLAVQGEEVEVNSLMRALAAHLAWNWGVAEAGRVEQDLLSQPEWMCSDSAEVERQGTLVSHVQEGAQLPPGVRYLLKVRMGRAELVDTAAIGGGQLTATLVDVDLLTRAQAQPILAALRREEHAQLAPHSTGLPGAVSPRLVESELLASARTTLVVCAGEQKTQPVLLDLVSAGPHAVVTGMTGSGKTEFLRAWLVALCCSYSPDHLSILIVDFKGGAGFHHVASLPHVVGIVTDLDTHEVHRAVMSLSAEVHRREKVLVDQAVMDIRDLPSTCDLGRLIVVVDEYRALVERFPEFAPLFIDLTSRGRALGIHLILSSQQTGSALSDSLLANCALRISFRLAQKQDSLAVLGSEAAWSLEHIPGRGVLQGTGMALRRFQAPLITEKDIELVRSRSHRWKLENLNWSPQSPWLPPLPACIEWSHAPHTLAGSAWLGLADLPEHQLQSWVQYSPTQDGNLFISGPTRSGITGTLHLIAQQFGVQVISHAEHAWDVIVEGADSSASVIVLDNLESIVEEFTLEHRDEFMRCLTARARELPRRGGALVVGKSDSGVAMTGFSVVFSSALTLQAAVTPGRGLWNGHEVQLLHHTPESARIDPTPELGFDEGTDYLVITRRLNQMRTFLRSRYPHRVSELGAPLRVTSGTGEILLGTPDAWLSHHHLLQEKLATAVLVIDSCSPSELRGLRVRPGLFPFVEEGKVAVITPTGHVHRALIKE